MKPDTTPVLDQHGRVMFLCGHCGAPISQNDFFDLGLRLPDMGETKGEYCDAELISSIEHVDCLRADRAS